MSGKLLTKKRTSKRSKTMTEQAKTEIATAVAAADLETLKARENKDGTLYIRRPVDGQTISIYFRHPVLADVIRQMADGNAPADVYNKIYKPLLRPIEGHPERVWTKPAVSKITKAFVTDGEFNWDAPRGILVYNPDLLEAGYTLTYKVEAPFDPAVARKWGKALLDGCKDILANARPFQMTWVMKEVTPVVPKAEALQEEPAF